MKKLNYALLLLACSSCVMASEQSDCEANAGTFLTGTVVSAPQFANSKGRLHGVELSHTHVQVMSDQDGKTYDVAIDNVFATDYVQNAEAIPNSLAAIYPGDHLEMCGKIYSDGTGIHWVHNNCNVRGTAKAPDGWVKQIAPDGMVGNNLESNQAYCYLWP